jgi:hypothetical protein
MASTARAQIDRMAYDLFKADPNAFQGDWKHQEEVDQKRYEAMALELYLDGYRKSEP